jgi:hypothetical protein
MKLILSNYPPAGGNYPPGTILVPIADIGEDPEETQGRDEDYDPTDEQELEDSIEMYGLFDPLGIAPTDPAWANTKRITLIHGVHRFGRIRKLASQKGLFANGVPCIPVPYSSPGDLAEKQFNENAHEEKICVKNKKRDLVRLIGRLFRDGTYAPMQGLAWNSALFNLPAGDPLLVKLFQEMTDYVNPLKSPLKLTKKTFTAAVGREIVDEIFNTHGAPPMRQIHLWSNQAVKAAVASGKVVKGYKKSPGTLHNNKLVVSMNPNDLRAKPMAVVNFLSDQLGGKNVMLSSKQNVEVTVVAAHNKATTDKALASFRTNVEDLCREFNAFLSNNTNGRIARSIDKIVFFPQKKNRASGNEKNYRTVIL